MTSLAIIVYRDAGYEVVVNWGATIETLGPYRWRWLARIVRWLNDGVH